MKQNLTYLKYYKNSKKITNFTDLCFKRFSFSRHPIAISVMGTFGLSTVLGVMLYSCVKFERDRTIGVREMERTSSGLRKKIRRRNGAKTISLPNSCG